MPATTGPRSAGCSAGAEGGLRAAWERGLVVLDAAMGTRLVAQGLLLRSDDPAVWNVTHPRDVVALHRRDVAAGARAVVTNTFGANRCWLAKFEQDREVESINCSAVALAREAAGRTAFVIGGLGPTVGQEPGAAAEQAAVLVECGVDALLLETFCSPQIEAVLEELSGLKLIAVPILASLWDWPAAPAPLARRLIDRGAAVIGMNCQLGIDAAVAFAELLSEQVPCPLLVKPSAGGAANAGSSPEAFAAALPRLIDHNVRLVGGCCGTTEAHVAALAAAYTMKRGSR